VVRVCIIPVHSQVPVMKVETKCKKYRFQKGNKDCRVHRRKQVYLQVYPAFNS